MISIIRIKVVAAISYSLFHSISTIVQQTIVAILPVFELRTLTIAFLSIGRLEPHQIRHQLGSSCIFLPEH